MSSLKDKTTGWGAKTDLDSIKFMSLTLVKCDSFTSHEHLLSIFQAIVSSSVKVLDRWGSIEVVFTNIETISYNMPPNVQIPMTKLVTFILSP